MHILVCRTVCYAPHNVSHYSSWLHLCSLVEALKINEAFVLNQEAIYEYSSRYNKLCRLLFLSLQYQQGWGWGGLVGRDGVDWAKGRRMNRRGVKKIVTVLAYKQSLTQSRTWLQQLSMHALEKEMATHSSILAWRIPGMEEPSGLLSMGLHRVGYDWSDLAAAAATEKPPHHN